MQGKIKSLLNCKVREMTLEESKLFLMLMMAEKNLDGIKNIDKKLKEDNFFPYMVMLKRLEAFKQLHSPTLDIDIAPQILCAMLSKNPAQVVMWAYTLNDLFVHLGRKVTLSDFIDAFPMGIPEEDEYRALWDLQKARKETDSCCTDNMIDDFSNWSLPDGKKD